MLKKITFRLFWLCVVCCMACHTFAQDLTELKQRYKHAQKLERKINYLNQILEICDNVDMKFHNNELKKLIDKATLDGSISKTNLVKYTSYYLSNYGIISENEGKMKLALDYHNRSLKLAKKIALESQIATCYQNIASIYDLQENHQKALLFSYKSLAIKEKTGNFSGIALSHNNMAVAFSNTRNFDSSIYHFKKSAQTFKKLGDQEKYALVLNNIGYEYIQKKQLDSASYYFDITVNFLEDKNDKEILIYSYLNLGEVYFQQNNFKKALVFSEKAYKLAKSYGTMVDRRNVLGSLHKIYKSLGKLSMALETYENYVLLKDSITNDENKAEVYRYEIKYENDKKILKIKNEQALRNKLNQEKLYWQRLINIIGVLGFLIICTFSFFLFKRFKLSRKQNQQITLQKAIIEEKQKEIHESISYAERIQKSFLASESGFENRFSEYFVLFEPKDVVSGDFYWFGQEDNNTFVCVADSTGHGIPGAFMSLLNISLLNEALFSKGLRKPAALLDFVRRILILGLKPDAEGQGGKDGMDCACILINESNSELYYTGANNPLWILRQNEIIEFKPDKMPVGRSPKDNLPFTEQQIPLEEGDIIYLFSDGFPDQFGGVNNKKYKYKPLAELLKKTANLGLAKQHEILLEEFRTWKGDCEQTDDVCVVGIKI